MTGHEGAPRLVKAAEFYDSLAPDYDSQWDAPHRRAYDDLAWDLTVELLPNRPARIVDVGCGVGRWAERYVAAGHDVVGLDPSPAMVARARTRGLGARFRVEEGGVDDVDLAGHDADLVVAMGSLQYAPDPVASIARMATWLRPGGALAVLCDSRLALVLELLAAGREDEAVERARGGDAEYRAGEVVVRHRLLDAATLRGAFRSADLEVIGVVGLLVSWSALGRQPMMERLEQQPEAQLALERRLATSEAIADAGKQLLGIARRRVAGVGAASRG